MLTAAELVGLMAEPERRRVVAALILSSGDLAHIVARSGLDNRQAVTALDRLTAAGLIELGSDGTYVIVEEAFKAAARVGAGRRIDEAAPARSVIDRAIVDGRLTHLPRKRSKRLLVLDHLSQEFEPGAHYSEREVNGILRAFDDDVATLRRHLVDEGFLDRSDGSYWRSGGTVNTPDSPDGDDWVD